MLRGFPSALRSHGLNSDVRIILDLYVSMSKGLVLNLGDLYSVGRALAVKDVRENGPYTIAFFSYFLDIDVRPGESLDRAIVRSNTFHTWHEKYAKDSMLSQELVDKFLEYVLHRSSDLEGIALEAEQVLQEKPEISVPIDQLSRIYRRLDVDYSDEELAEIVRRMKEIAARQKEVHSGHNIWIGTQGTSAYGHSGRSGGGIRVGGRSVSQTARMIIDDPRYLPVDIDAALSDNNIDAALASLSGVAEHGSHLELDIKRTIRNGVRRGGIFIPELRREKDERLNVLLFIDNGGYSMDPYIGVVQSLFRKMKTRFAHDFQTYYFHNIFDEVVYADQSRRTDPVELDGLMKLGKHQRVFIVGDASMAPDELHHHWGGKTGMQYLREMTVAFPRTVWLNPVRQSRWDYTTTIRHIREIVSMFPLTPRGIEKSIEYLNQVSTSM